MNIQHTTHDALHGDPANPVYQKIRSDTYGRDIGQTAWVMAEEFDRFLRLLGITAKSTVVEIACGSGGPGLFLARTTGCLFAGYDIDATSIARANAGARQPGLTSRVRFYQGDATQQLPVDSDSVDSLLCFDAVHRLPNRSATFREWFRLLKLGGRLLFTDPAVITGHLTNQEIAARSSSPYIQYSPHGANERLLREAGFELLLSENSTENVSHIAKRWKESRERHRKDLVGIEGEALFTAAQNVLECIRLLAAEKRISRYTFLAEKRA